MYIDTHTHLQDERYNGEGPDIASGLKADGVRFIINIGYDAVSSLKSLELAGKYDNVYAAAAIHPQNAEQASQSDYDDFIRYAASPKFVAIGETGLDYHYEGNREIQKRVFIKHIEIAYSLKLPVVIHIRDAYEDAYNIIKENKNKMLYGGVVHCFSGSAETAERFLKLGLYISFGGAVTFKNARGLLDAVKVVPLDRILTETDCPYLTPEPFRGKLNYPAYVKYIADKIAQIKNIGVYELNENAYKNARALFTKITI
jgi:TatD DNase family protein